MRGLDGGQSWPVMAQASILWQRHLFWKRLHWYKQMYIKLYLDIHYIWSVYRFLYMKRYKDGEAEEAEYNKE